MCSYAQVSQTVNEPGASQLSVSTYYTLLKLLCTCASKSATVAEQLLNGGLLEVLYTLLSTSTLLPTAEPPPGGIALWSVDQLQEVCVTHTHTRARTHTHSAQLARNTGQWP